MLSRTNQINGKRAVILDLVNEFFPFHLIINEGLQLIQVGKGINKLLDTKKTSNFFEAFEILPDKKKLSFNEISSLHGKTVSINLIGANIIIRTQLSFRPQDGLLIFAGTPRMNDLEMITRTSITIEDFAPYDATPDFMFINQALKSSYAEAVELNHQLEEQKNMLLRSNQELDKFVYIASHDLQTPLRTVVGFSQLLEKLIKDIDDEKIKEYINYIKTAGINMSNLIKGLLEYTKISKGVLTFEEIDLNEILNAITENFRFLVKEQNVQLIWEKLPVINGDRLLLNQLLSNLIDNGIKYRSDKAPVIHVKCEELEDYWKISVQDNGQGISMQYQEKVFAIFQRLHGQDEYTGTGIGLSICKAIVEKHKGKIGYTASPNGGATFFFTLDKYLG